MRSLVYLVALALPLAAFAQGKQGTKNAGVNWEGQVIKATGSGAPDLKAANPAQARLGAERAAQLDAFRNLLAQVKGIQISAGKTVGDQMENDEVRGKVEGVVRGFKITGKRYYSDSGVEIDVEVPLAALTEALLPAGGSAVALKTEGEAVNTGLVVDARGLAGVTPALAPRLLDPSGKALYAAGVLHDEARRAVGVAAWSKSLESAKKDQRVGAHPLVVKAEKVNGTDLVLAAADAQKLASGNNSYLAEGRVIIVTQ